MLKQHLTNRKFYNKYMYKASLNIPGISIYRTKTLLQTIELLESSAPYKGLISDTINKAYKNKTNIIALSNFLLQMNGDYVKRIERDTIDFYTNDQDIHSKICSNFASIVKNSYIPRSDLRDELDSNKYIICKKLPHKKYKFKVYLLPHKLKHCFEDKKAYVDWLARQKNVNISEKTQTWFLNTNWYWDRRYMYVTDAQTLLLVKMRNPNVLGRIYEYLVSDK